VLDASNDLGARVGMNDAATNAAGAASTASAGDTAEAGSSASGARAASLAADLAGAAAGCTTVLGALEATGAAVADDSPKNDTSTVSAAAPPATRVLGRNARDLTRGSFRLCGSTRRMSNEKQKLTLLITGECLLLVRIRQDADLTNLNVFLPCC
jgi:hypothetical protein